MFLLVYVSCGPKSLSKDLKKWLDLGWKQSGKDAIVSFKAKL